MPSDSLSRTLVLSVVAVDLVGYSRKSVAEQMSLKEQFNQVLLQAIGDISIGDRIILDTGDGVAIGFLGDPEDALFVAMFMHDTINRDSGGSPSGGMDTNAIRIGINLGPVKLATGIGGHPNIIGDGINVAERIMQFAEPGQLTASRPLVEVMTRMSDHYATLFRFAGTRTDKQVRAHEVYLVNRSVAAFQHARRGVLERAGKSFSDTGSQPAIHAAMTSALAQSIPKPAPTSVAPAASMASNENGLADFLEDRNKVATTAFLLAVVAVVLAALLVYRKVTTGPKSDISTTPVAAAPIAPVTDKAAAVLDVPTMAAAPAMPTATPTNAPASAPAPVAASAGEKAKSSATPASSPAPVAAPVTAPPTSQAKTAPALTAPATTVPTKETAPVKAAPSVAVSVPAATIVNPVKIEPPPATPREPARKPATKSGEQRVLPSAATPLAPAYQAPEPPRQEPVTPTPPAAIPVEVPDVNAVAISRTAPTFPIEAVRQGITSGTVKARATIDARGNVVGEVTILEAKPLSAFGREARQSMKNWKFNPGAPNRTYEVEISFKQ